MGQGQGERVEVLISSCVLIKNGRVIDPSSGLDEIADILIEDGRIRSVGESSDTAETVIDARGLVVAPGFIDLHVHLRDPGHPAKETVESGVRSAVAGGFTGIASMANTDPPIDTPSAVESIGTKARAAGYATVYPIAACTVGRDGKELTDMAALAEAGAMGFSDDGDFVADTSLMRQILTCAKTLGKPVLAHCEVKKLSGNGVMHEGLVSAQLKLPGIPAEAEDTAVARDIALAEQTDAALHIMHISTAGAVDIVRQAKERGMKITTEAAPHHFALTDEEIRSLDTNMKMNPPLRAAADVEAVKAGLADGTIECIASDHAPHTAEEKALDFATAPCGIIGMETVLPVTLTELVHTGVLSLDRAIACFTINPARVLGIDRGTLAPGAPADITIFDPDEEWTIDTSTFESLSRNCPFDGRTVKGRIRHVLVNGVVKLP